MWQRRRARQGSATPRADTCDCPALDEPDPRTGDITFATCAKEWLGSDPAKSPSALARDESIVRVHLLPTLANRRLALITPRDVQAFVSLWSNSAKPRTVRRQYDTLRAILNAAADADLGAVLGLRWGEVAGMRVDALDFLARTVSVAVQCTRANRPEDGPDRPGHADPRLTLAVYAQATKEADRDAADRLGEHFNPPERLARGTNAG